MHEASRSVRLTACAAPVWAIAVGIWLWVTPMQSIVSSGAQSHVESHPFSDGSSGDAIPLIVPVAFAFLAAFELWHGRRSKFASVMIALLGAFVILGGFSIGLLYLPSLILLVVAFKSMKQQALERRLA